MQIATPEQPSLHFELSHEAAAHHKKVLQQHGNSLRQYLCTQYGTYISFGSDVRPPWALEKLLCLHPN